jgi:general secretion pathway protein G
MILAPPGANCPRAAFTLLELLTVITLLALLGGLVLGGGRHAIEAGRTARARAELATICAALENYQRLLGDYPQTDDGVQLLQSLIGRRGPRNAAIAVPCQLELARFTTADALDPFTDRGAVLVDPWGRPYRYVYKVPLSGWQNVSYVVYSRGPDGLDAGALLAGGFLDPSAPPNADNIFANR